MSTVEYKLKPVPGTPVPFDWKNDPFYTSAVVLGIDIGIEGIGIWLRKGLAPIYYRTFIFETPNAAPLENRRGLRAGRRCRQAEQRREVALKIFCSDFGLPWVEITDKGRDDGPFRFRWIATRKDTDGLRDIRAFTACLRHIIRHRGYQIAPGGARSKQWRWSLSAALNDTRLLQGERDQNKTHVIGQVT
jgi:hypothetical protein